MFFILLGSWVVHFRTFLDELSWIEETWEEMIFKVFPKVTYPKSTPSMQLLVYSPLETGVKGKFPVKTISNPNEKKNDQNKSSGRGHITGIMKSYKFLGKIKMPMS